MRFKVEHHQFGTRFTWFVVDTKGPGYRDVAGFFSQEDAQEYVDFLNQKYGG